MRTLRQQSTNSFENHYIDYVSSLSTTGKYESLRQISRLLHLLSLKATLHLQFLPGILALVPYTLTKFEEKYLR